MASKWTSYKCTLFFKLQQFVAFTQLCWLVNYFTYQSPVSVCAVPLPSLLLVWQTSTCSPLKVWPQRPLVWVLTVPSGRRVTVDRGLSVHRQRDRATPLTFFPYNLPRENSLVRVSPLINLIRQVLYPRRHKLRQWRAAVLRLVLLAIFWEKYSMFIMGREVVCFSPIVLDTVSF